MMNIKNKQIDKIVNYLVSNLKDDMIIHVYQAFKTDSIYLKFDYGVANSLRISDHNGYERLSYRFNILLDIKKYKVETSRGYLREYFPPNELDRVISNIKKNKLLKQQKYPNYENLIEIEKRKAKVSPYTFWRLSEKI